MTFSLWFDTGGGGLPGRANRLQSGVRYRDEDSFTAALRRRLPSRGRVRLGIGDDAAVLAGGTVLTVDGYRQGVHFDLHYLSWREVGARCACAALSDVVAMGARPDALFVTLALPPAARRRDVTALYRGLDSVCARLGCEIAGGDTIAGRELLLALAATGRTQCPLLRAGARPGDGLYLTGQAGAAETGRLRLARDPAASRRNPAVSRHVRPRPRLEAMLALRPRITALIDTSDGIAGDARRLARASEVRIIIAPEHLPTLTATRTLCRRSGRDLTEFILTAGEDHELLFCARGPVPGRAGAVPVTRIGRVERGRGLWLERAGRRQRLTLRGYDHLRP
ncbi:MAG TPA: thiamine-phosphate kinase [candidate division WOR-3 bacterium]|uniref:Thiamine-monophosphate kinase n=1 Tax=candidate division WOR-3 bacterium TaxID=2052148 RepID=A0A7V0XED2_UNCW3|nr:thiamine-phosphate kinase [candidate division WOR-3 bacterium]